MQYMILRKADDASPTRVDVVDAAPASPGRSGRPVARGRPAAGVTVQAAETLRPTAEGALAQFSGGQARVTNGPFNVRGGIDSFALVEAPTRAAAIDWAVAQVGAGAGAGDAEGPGEVSLEVRDGGCPGGLRGVPASGDTAGGPAAGGRYMLLLKANERAETGAVPGGDGLAQMARRNDEAAAAGVLLMGEGLKTSASAARVTVPTGGRGKPFIIDGPFAEAKELLAGFWIIRAASLQAAVDWTLAYPFPFRDTEEVVVEVRRLEDAGVPEAAGGSMVSAAG